MALNKYIAVKICGNPDSNSGFTPIFLFNSPSFSIEDEFYVGFDNCSFFYTIRTTNTQTIYKLVKNNVRSYGASRAGSLVIAFSIPKGYALRNGCTPYDVLSKLKDTFLERCMTCKDAVRETYEFNQGRIDLKILDDVAQVFFIEPKSCPNRIMPPNAPKGYIVKNNLEIEQFFHDTNYPEFDNFSEIIIADSVTQTNYIPINNIQIPRRINYSIYVNGKFERSCDDLNEQLTALSNKPKEYYDNKSVTYTIQELKDGKIIDGFAFDEIQERIDISTLNWAKPKSETFWIRIESPKKFDNSLINRNLIKVISTSYTIRLDNDLSFTLIGEQIADLRNLTYSLADNLRGKYEISSCKINGDMITIAIDTIRMASDIEQQHRKFPPIPVPQDKSQKKIEPIVDTLTLEQKDFKIEQKDFKIEQKDFVKRNISLVKTFAFSLLTLLFFALGYAVHDPIQSLFAKPEQATNNTDTVTVVTDEHISEEDAEEILKKAEERLKAKDIKFEEITDFYQKFNDDSVTLMAQDKQNFDNKICNRIKDYYTISQYIINGDFDSIKSFIQYPKQPHIWDTHKQIISKIIESDDTRSKFMNRYSNLKSFVDIDELFKSLPPSNEREEKPKVKQIKSDTKQEEKINVTETPNKQLKER